MVIYRFVLAALLATTLMLTGCGMPGFVASCAEQSKPFLDQIQPLARKWDDANNLASQTPRMQLAVQIANLQAVRREAQDLKPPECAKPVQDALVGSMDATIQGFLDFMSQKPDTTVQVSFAKANEQMSAFTKALAVVQGLSLDPTVESK
jgi:hypothetical protein